MRVAATPQQRKGHEFCSREQSFANHSTRFASAQLPLPLRIHTTQWLQQLNVLDHAEEIREGRILLHTSVAGLYRRTRTAVRSRTSPISSNALHPSSLARSTAPRHTTRAMKWLELDALAHIPLAINAVSFWP